MSRLSSSKKHSAPHVYTMRDIFGATLSREKALALIQSDDEAFCQFKTLSDASKDKILSFIQGNSGLKILNDKCFLRIMNPILYPERLNSMLSAILEEPVRVHAILPRQGNILTENSSYVIMDILVELENGTIINVEVQRVGYYFPGARSTCYLSDLIMRQYSKVRTEKGKDFSYNHLKPTILIVLMEHSSRNFTAVSPHYIHREQVSYDSGAVLKSLTHTIYISLDTFRSVVHNIDTELDAWLTFLGSDDPADIVKLINTYPEFLDYYKEILEFRRNPKELMFMYSEILAQMDRNMEKYMADEMQAQINAQKAELDKNRIELDKNRIELDKNRIELDKSRIELNKTHSQLNECHNTIDTLQSQLNAALSELAALKTSQ